MNISTLRQAALLSLRGLAVGDAFGQSFFIPEEQAVRAIQERQAPPPPWYYTDDTLQALSLVTVLLQYGVVEQDAFAASLAQGYQPDRGYGPGMHNHLARLRAGEPWRVVATARNDGAGSLGNGAAMRVAPLGAYFAEDLSVVATQASLRSSHLTIYRLGKVAIFVYFAVIFFEIAVRESMLGILAFWAIFIEHRLKYPSPHARQSALR